MRIELERDPDDNAPQVQAAIDACKAKGGGEVVLRPRAVGGAEEADGPPFPWPFRRPVFLDGDNLTVTGQGRWRTFVTAGSGGYGPWVYGFKYRRGLPAAHWEPAADLDASAGARRAVRTRNAASLAAHGSPLENGPPGGWEAVRAFTIDVAFRVHNKSPDGSLALVGMRDAVANLAAPWHVAANEQLLFSLALRERPGETVIRGPWTASPGEFCRLRLQVDLDSGLFAGWADGRRLALTTNGVSLAGRSLVARRDNCPAKIGSMGGDLYQWGNGWGGPHDTSFQGLKVTLGRVYDDSDSAAAPARLDGQPTNDFTSYFRKDAATAFHLPLEEDAPADRTVVWSSGVPVPGVGDVHGHGLLLRAADGGGRDAVTDLLLRGLWSRVAGPYGSGFAQGACYDARFEDCRFGGGESAFHGLPTFVNYRLLFERALFDGGARQGLFLNCSTSALRNCSFGGYRRHALVALGCNLDADGLIFAQSLPCESMVRVLDGQQGGRYAFRNSLFDFEDASPSRAYVEIDGHSVGAVPYTVLKIADSAFGALAAGLAHVRLNSPTPPPAGRTPFACRVEDVSAYGSPYFQVCGPGWALDFKGERPPGGPLAIDADGREVAAP